MLEYREKKVLCQRKVGDIVSKFIDWVKKYDLFLFDLDGLLVDTETLHYRAYQKMCLQRGYVLSLDFSAYCGMAHMGSESLKEGVYKLFPALYEEEPNWAILHKEKQKAFLEILSKEGVALMPGVEKVLRFLMAHQKKCCVVTHSPSQLTDEIKEKHPILKSIHHWVTREQYDRPKPDPDSYQMAIKLYAKPQDKVIGFEDSVRGFMALFAAGIDAVVISSILNQEMKKFLKEKGAIQYSSFNALITV